ncbi:MAG: hypothetical protein DRP64_09120 [Verrucomicrobia bacterium]|nr:MAG: hypothetical protein DRP64_09120 [Verrucomicrobiota bacterium]
MSSLSSEAFGEGWIPLVSASGTHALHSQNNTDQADLTESSKYVLLGFSLLKSLLFPMLLIHFVIDSGSRWGWQRRKAWLCADPGRYVGAEEQEDDGAPIEDKMDAPSAMLYEQMEEAQNLDTVIRQNLERLGFGSERAKRNPGP